MSDFKLKEINHEYIIRDEYLVEIIKNNEGDYVAFSNERIRSLHSDPADAHINFDETLCVAAKNSSHYQKHCRVKSDFIQYLLKPFLYAHSFDELYNTRPWPTRSHNHLGLLEEYSQMNNEEKEQNKEVTLQLLSEYGLVSYNETFHETLCDSNPDHGKIYEELFKT